MVLSRLTKITSPGIKTDTNWVGNNATFTGVTTSGSSFNVGVTTIHSTLAEVHNIKSTGIITATGGSFSGNVTAVDGTFSGNVSIAGTLTYEDVTNIDSVGIITAPALDVDDFLDVGSNIKLGNAGVITATSFVGSGAALTGIDATAIKDSGGNVKIQAQASGAVYTGIHTFTALTVSGGNVPVAITHTGADGLTITRSSKAFGINANHGASNTHSAINVSSGMALRFQTNGTDRVQMDSSGNWTPTSDNARNLGTSSLRWANIYSADIHCSNKGSSNDVDGTWGDFTIQEGESDLFLINNRSGKKYKFNLTEVN